MLPFARLGPLLIQLPGLVILAGIWIGVELAGREATRLRLNGAVVMNLVMYGLASGLLAARLLYVLGHLTAYMAAPLGIFSLSATALDAWGGYLLGALAAYAYARRKGLALLATLDALAPAIAVFMIALGTANLLSGDGYGSRLDAPWAIFLWGEYRHPTQIYETLTAVGVFWVWRLAPAGELAPGNSFWQVLGLSALGRVFTEALHADSRVWIAGLRLAQLLAVAILGVSILASRRGLAEKSRAHP